MHKKGPLLKLGFSEKATKFEKNLRRVLCAQQCTFLPILEARAKILQNISFAFCIEAKKFLVFNFSIMISVGWLRKWRPTLTWT